MYFTFIVETLQLAGILTEPCNQIIRDAYFLIRGWGNLTNVVYLFWQHISLLFVAASGPITITLCLIVVSLRLPNYCYCIAIHQNGFPS